MKERYMRTITILVMICLLLGCSGSKKIHSHQKKYLPPELQHLYFGMPFTDFSKIYTDISVNEIMEFRKSVHIKDFTNDIKELTVYFDNDANIPLYEFIIDYYDVTFRDDIVALLYGKPNYNNDEWNFDSKEGYDIRIWTFNHKIVIAAFIAGTEWNEEE